MKIAIFNDYQLPVPAVLGGSVPTLINFIIDENEYGDLDIDMYSCYNKNSVEQSKKYKKTKFIFSKDAGRVRFFTNLKFKIMNKLRLPIKLSNIPLPSSAKKYFLKQNYDLVFINGYIRGANSILKLSKAPVIYQHHVVTDIAHEKTIDGKYLLENAKKILFVSDFASNFAKTDKEQYNEKIGTFLNAIDINKFMLEERDIVRQQIREKLGIGQQDTVLLYIGRMVEYKGCLELINAFNSCKFEDDVKLILVGGATYSSKKVTPFVQKCLDEAKKNKNIILTGSVSYEEIPKYYCAADISTLPSRCNEAAGLVGIESMASGLPIITTDRGGIGEYVSNECKIVTPDDENIVESMAAAMKTLVQDPEKRQQMGIAGIKRAKQFSKENYYKNFLEIVKNTI